MLRGVLRSIIGMAALVAAMSFIVPGKTGIQVQFRNYVGSAPLKLDSATYKNELGQTYTVSKFKYYVGNITLQKKNGEECHSAQYFLINEEDEASKQIALTDIPEGE